MLIRLDDQELATILASLRYYQSQGLADPQKRPDEIHAIATDCECETSLDNEWIEKLCQKINSPEKIWMAVEIDGGCLREVYSEQDDFDVVLLDWDNEENRGFSELGYGFAERWYPELFANMPDETREGAKSFAQFNHITGLYEEIEIVEPSF